MRRFIFFVFSLFYVLICQRTAMAADEDSQPNIVLIIADIADPEASLLFRGCIKGKWKLLLTYDGEVNRYKSTHPRDEKGPQLFDLLKDPHETTNVAAKYPRVVARLANRIAGWYEVKTRTTRITVEVEVKVVTSASYVLSNNGSSTDSCWMDLYLDACHKRRALRMGPHVDKFPKIVFTKHHDIGGQHYAYTEDVSDSPYRDNNPFPNTGKLCLFEMDGLYGTSRVLLDEPKGLIRDPDVSYDGQRILFAWRKSMDHEDVKLTLDELNTIACWIDLGVPFSGDYTEGMSPDQIPKYQVYLDKRLKHAAQDEEAIKAFLEEVE